MVVEQEQIEALKSKVKSLEDELFYARLKGFFEGLFLCSITEEQIRYIFANKSLPKGCNVLVARNNKLSKADKCRIVYLLKLDIRTAKNIFGDKTISYNDVPKDLKGSVGSFTRINIYDSIKYICDMCGREIGE